MPIKQAAIKAFRQMKRRKAHNDTVRAEVAKIVRLMRKHLDAKDVAGAKALVSRLQKTVNKAAKRGVIAHRAAARITSRFMKKIA